MVSINEAWNTTDDPVHFWRMVTSVSPHLGRIARRLWSTTANSVPSERAFSTMNYIHSRLRNRLTPERANKLQYIYINERAIRSLEAQVLSEEDMLQMEDDWIEEQGTTVQAQAPDGDEQEDFSLVRLPESTIYEASRVETERDYEQTGAQDAGSINGTAVPLDDRETRPDLVVSGPILAGFLRSATPARFFESTS